MFEYGPYLRKNRGCFRAEDFKSKTPEEKAKAAANRDFYAAQEAANRAADAVVFSHRGTDYRVWQVMEGVYVSGLTEAQKADLREAGYVVSKCPTTYKPCSCGKWYDRYGVSQQQSCPVCGAAREENEPEFFVSSGEYHE